jgi:multidrug efflux pump subunit AcrA (membrane-fusion protein)
MIGTIVVGGARTAPQPVLPLSAIVRPPGAADGYAVFVVEEQEGRHTARLRRVKLGEAMGNGIAVTDGVKVGDRVIVAGASLTTDGEAVQIVP